MPKYSQDSGQISDGVNLLISILVRYPEVGAIDYDPETQTLKLTFMLSGIPSPDDFAAAKRLLIDSMAAYHLLEGLDDAISDIALSECEQVSMLKIIRDVKTLSQGEIALIITLLRDSFKNRLVTDCNDAMPEEDLLVQEELIEDMLENLKKDQAHHKLIGIREDGRVLVFNK
ncbi:MAG: hypothetical protein N2491_00400 [Negativicutes bacterium]|nr:hypothetical protein [Negativicutes bacterium]